MSIKQDFIKYVEDLISNSNVEMPEEINAYWIAFKGKDNIEKPLLTDNGKLILECLQNHPEITMWRAKEIADALEIASRSVSGSIRKLAEDGFVEKIGKDPVIYTITEKGKNIKINE